MTKLIQFTLAKIKYSGDSIGDDIRIEIECPNHSLDVNKEIKHGGEAVINTAIGNFITDQSLFSLPVSVKVIERDLIFNDVGSAQKEFKVDTQNTAPQFLTVPIEIKEARNHLTKKKAFFEVIFEAKILEPVAYVTYEGGKGGWTLVSSGEHQDDISLPMYLKVQIEKQNSERHYFKILEGVRHGERASVTTNVGGIPTLQTRSPHKGSVRLTYSISKQRVMFKSRQYMAAQHPDDPHPWEKGLYNVEIPDAPHRFGESYLDRAALAKVWFKVSHPDNDRYLHTGRVSLGRVTLTEIERWDDLCKVLLTARKGDGLNIGRLEVVD